MEPLTRSNLHKRCSPSRWLNPPCEPRQFHQPRFQQSQPLIRKPNGRSKRERGLGDDHAQSKILKDIDGMIDRLLAQLEATHEAVLRRKPDLTKVAQHDQRTFCVEQLIPSRLVASGPPRLVGQGPSHSRSLQT